MKALDTDRARRLSPRMRLGEAGRNIKKKCMWVAELQGLGVVQNPGRRADRCVPGGGSAPVPEPRQVSFAARV